MRVCLTWILLVVGAAAAEPERLVPVNLSRGPGGGFGNLYLLGQQAVQQDLQLTAEQLAKVHHVLRQLVDKQEAFAREKDAGKRKQLADEALQVGRQNDKLLVGMLTPPQAQRLRQIALHYRTTASLWDPEVRTALAITDEQFAKMTEISRAFSSTWNQEAGAAYGKDKDFPAYQRKLNENRQRRDREQVGVLTPEQQVQWKKLLGDPFRGPIPSPILLPAVVQAAVPDRPAPAAEPREDSVDRLARTIQALAQEIIQLNQENRRLREENERLRSRGRDPIKK